MEAPEKIYLVNDDLNIKQDWYKTKQVGFETTEYTRTDTFIDKSCKWLEENAGSYLLYPFCEYDRGALLEDFKKAMEEE